MPLFRIMSFVIFTWLSALWCALILFYASMDWQMEYQLGSVGDKRAASIHAAEVGDGRTAKHVLETTKVRHAEN